MSAHDVIKTQLEALRVAKRNRSSTRCLQIITVISDFFDSPRSAVEIKYAIELLLRESDKKLDLTKLLITAITVKTLQECACKVLELIQRLTTLHSSFVRPYTNTMLDVCTQILRCPEPSARFKELTVRSIDAIIRRDAMVEEERENRIETLIVILLAVLEQPVKNRLFGNVFELLGRMSRQFPTRFPHESAKRLLEKTLALVQNLFKDDKASVSLMLVSGAVDCLTSLLANFTSEDENFAKRLHECMILLADPFGSESNRVAFRNMLACVSLHAHLVSDFIFIEHLRWHNLLVQWTNAKNHEDRNAGVRAMQAIHVEIGKNIAKRRREQDKPVLLFYMNFFQSTLESPNAQPHEIRIAIKGVGAMAAGAKILLEPKYLNGRFDLVMQRTESAYHAGDRMRRREVLEHLPTCVEALSRIMRHVDEISGIQLQSLEAIMVILIKDFHFLSTSHHAQVAVGLLDTLANLEKIGGKVFGDVVEAVTWQGVLWTCSHQLTYDIDAAYEDIKDWKETITYKRYLPLWKRLLTPSDERHKRIGEVIYEHFMKNLFLIIEKLDLSTRKRKYFDDSANTDIEFFFTDPSLELEAVRPENFQILYNLTQFYGDIITQQTNSELETFFIQWLELWLEKSIALAMRNPLVSAFMKLVEHALRIIARLRHANARFMNSKAIDTLRMYVKLLFARSNQVSDELQVACLSLIFQSPIAILKDSLDQVIISLTIGFEVGRGVVGLAHHALTCFEAMTRAFSDDPRVRRKLLERILPCLETFLSSSGKEIVASEELKELKYRRHRKRTVIHAVDTDLMRLRKRILLFLGTCTPDESLLLLANLQPRLTRDCIESGVFGITLHSDDSLSPQITLDAIVERVCHVALHSSERATKVSACELLHGLLLYTMGKGLRDATETLPIWKNLCRDAIMLGAEKDQTIRALFEPLLMQMMHFYARPDQILSSLSTALMEVVMEMISYRDNSVQDLSARLLREYILWLMRQTNSEQRKLAPVTLVDFFHELKKMSIETEQSRQMGATLAFNNIYRIVREEESLIDIYWIYLLDVFCINFKNTEDFSSHLDNAFVDNRRFDQVSASLDHITRVFVERSDIFTTSNRNRIKPFGFTGITLTDVLNWLLEQCGAPQYFYRRKCMEMFEKILPQCDNKTSFFEQNWSVEALLKIGDIQSGMKIRPDLTFLRDTTEPVYKETFNWLSNFLRLLEFYEWVFKSKLLPPNHIRELLASSVVNHSLAYVVTHVIGVSDMSTLVRSIDASLLNTSQMSYEAKMHNRNLDKVYVMRSVVAMAILRFLATLMELNVDFRKNDDALVKVIKILIFKPHKLSFDHRSQCIVGDLRDQLRNFITIASKNANVFHTKLIEVLKMKIEKHLSGLRDQCEAFLTANSIAEAEENKIRGIDLLVTNFKSQLDLNASEEIARDFLKTLFEGLAETRSGVLRPKCLKPAVKKFANSALQACLKINITLEVLVSLALNSERLQMTETCSITKGENFLQVFGATVFEVFTANIQATATLFVSHLNDFPQTNPRIINVLSELNEFLYKSHSQSAEHLNANIHAMVSIWPAVMKAASSMDNDLNCVDMALINLVTQIAMACPYELHLLGQRLENFQKWLFGLFARKENSLEIKSKGVFLLPCVTHSEDKSNDELMRALNKIREFHLPFRSAEFPDGSLQRSSFVVFTNAIFQALLTSKSPIVYKFILHITINDEKYVLEEKLQRTQRELIESLSQREQETFLLQTFEAFLNDQLDPEIRLTIVSRYLLTIMKSARVDTVGAFVRQKISQIWQLLDANFDFDPATAFVKRSGGYMIVEAFAATVPKEEIEAGTYSYGGGLNNGLSFIKEFIMKAKDVRRDVVFVVNDLELQEIFRKFQCCCYRALATVVANTKDLPEVFNLCLFQETPQRGSFVWRKLVNVLDENVYANFSQDFEETPKVKEHIVSIRAIDTVEGSRRNYIEDRMSIFDRSLSQSLTKTDLSYAVVLTNRERLISDQRRQQQMHITLESIAINEHEVMGSLVAVVNAIFARKLSIFTDFANADRKKYEWALSIANSLVQRDQHRNVKLFLAKLIDNCRHVFVHYAEFFLEPVLRILTDGSLGFETLNFFVTDLTVMLLSWSHVYKPTRLEEKESAGMLLKFLMQHAYHERNEIFRMNLELIKKVVESWSEVLSGKIPTQILLDLLRDENVKLICGIQLNAVVLANSLVPWSNNEQCEHFIKAILASFHNPSAKVHQAAAQLMGMCLQTIDNEDCVSIVRERLEKFASSRERADIFLQLLYGIHKSFPAILDAFMARVVQSIPSAVRKIKCMFLEMFLARMEIFGASVYRELTVIQINSLLKQTEYQVLALHILNKSVVYLTKDEFFAFYDDLSYLVSSPDSTVRGLIYEIMMFSLEKFKTDATFERQKPLKILLKGFDDSNQEIQNRTIAFFNDTSELSPKILDRFGEILSSYFDPKLEKEFLHYATQLLLEIPIRHMRSKRKLLDHDPRDDANFFEIPIATKSSNSSSMPPPMFVGSQQRQLLAGDGSQLSQMIRATQLSASENRMFEPTQDPEALKRVAPTFELAHAQNSLLVSLKPHYLSRRSSFAPQTQENLTLDQQIERNKEKFNPNTLDHLRRRILKRSDEQKSKDFALRAVEQRDFAEDSKREKIKRMQQGSEVVLYRRYRVGDFPDFYFNSLAILLPLQALVKKDTSIARHVFIAVFTALVATFRENHDDESERSFFSSINESILNVLKTSHESNSHLLPALVEMVLRSEKYLEIAPSTLNDSLSVTGILFLESQLNHLGGFLADDNNDRRKRIRLDENDMRAQHWIRLVELYHRISEFSIVNGILADKLSLTEPVKVLLLRAVESEASGAHRDAMTLYSELLSGDLARNASERDLYHASYFNCLAHLNDWRVITETVQTQIKGGYEELWSERNRKIHLPMLLKGELRRIIDGDTNDGFLAVLETWLSDEERAEHLLKSFPEEIAMLNVLDENFAACCVETDKALVAHCAELSSLEMHEAKTRVLLRARNLAEIANLAGVMSADGDDAGAERIFESWRVSTPKAADSLVLWNDLLAYRKTFLANLMVKFNVSDEKRQHCESLLIDTERSLLEVAFAQKNTDAAKALIGRLHGELRESTHGNVLKYNLAFGKYVMALAERESLGSFTRAIKRYGNAWDSLKSGVLDEEEGDEMKIDAFCCTSQIALRLMRLYAKLESDDAVVGLRDGFMELMGVIDESAEMVPSLLTYSERALTQARNLEKISLDRDFSIERELHLGAIHLQLAKYYRHVFAAGISRTRTVQVELMQSIFLAINHGEAEAKIFIPYVLSQLPELSAGRMTSEFNAHIATIPEWIFIAHISHVLSNFDFQAPCFLDGLVKKLAKKYPRALYYAFKLSRDNFHQVSGNKTTERELVSEINALVSSEIMEKFTSALQCLVVPEKLLETHFQGFCDELSARRQFNSAHFNTAVRELHVNVFGRHSEMRGGDFMRIHRAFSKKILDLGSLDWESERDVIFRRVRTLQSNIASAAKLSMRTVELSKLCPWLADYKWGGSADFIEIPGQYGGDYKPFIEQHAKIVRFETRLSVFSSKQLPLELRVFGSDGKTYSFIVKYGEDLRQDQRIQEVTRLMSQKLALDRNCKQNRLQIDTYRVTPINSFCGLLQMVTGSLTITDFMQRSSRVIPGKPFNELVVENRLKIRNSLLGENLFTGWIDTYERALLSYDRARLEEIYEESQREIPLDIVQKALRALSLTLHAFFVLRKNFVTSLAAMNAAHWLLGIGDRHLSNILINTSNARLIAIDFGIAFGTAATLGVPELIPFRLTPHFVGVLEPMATNGLIKESMNHALRCFRNHKEILLICLEVFVKEPTLDWLRQAKLKKSASSDDSASESSLNSVWDPESRVNVVRRKLDGGNPIELLIEELKIGPMRSKEELLRKYVTLIRGEEESKRSKYQREENDLRTEDQIECLIELATDKAILATTYVGWDSWF